MAAGFGGSSAQASNFASPATGFGFGGAIGAGAPQSAPDADADGPQQSVLRKTLKYDIPPHVPPSFSTLHSHLIFLAGLRSQAVVALLSLITSSFDNIRERTPPSHLLLRYSSVSAVHQVNAEVSASSACVDSKIESVSLAS
jgi:hypothetical protein